MNIRTKYPKTYYPLSDELCSFMDNNNNFTSSLKLSNTSKFEFIPIIFTSHLPHWHKLAVDEVIGMWYLDKENLKKGEFPLFKQDFIVNKNSDGKIFNSYVDKKTYDKNKNHHVLTIDNFFIDYGEWDIATCTGRFYVRENSKPWMHHYNELKD